MTIEGQRFLFGVIPLGRKKEIQVDSVEELSTWGGGKDPIREGVRVISSDALSHRWYFDPNEEPVANFILIRDGINTEKLEKIGFISVKRYRWRPSPPTPLRKSL